MWPRERIWLATTGLASLAVGAAVASLVGLLGPSLRDPLARGPLTTDATVPTDSAASLNAAPPKGAVGSNQTPAERPRPSPRDLPEADSQAHPTGRAPAAAAVVGDSTTTVERAGPHPAPSPPSATPDEPASGSGDTGAGDQGGAGEDTGGGAGGDTGDGSGGDTGGSGGSGSGASADIGIIGDVGGTIDGGLDDVAGALQQTTAI